MANPERGEVKLGDLTLGLTARACIAAERTGGMKLPARLIAAEEEGFGFEDVQLLIWAGGLEARPDWSLDDAAAEIDAHGFPACAAAIREAVLLAFPAPSAEGNAKSQRGRSTSTGKGSSAIG